MCESKLSNEQKTYVVQRLAGFDSGGAVAKWLREEYEVTISRQAIKYYDPTSYRGRRCAEPWKSLFYETRAAIIAGKAEIGAANKMVRVRWLDIMARAEMDKENSVRAAALLRQVAEEMGDRFTNRQKLEHTGKDGGTIDIAAVTDRDRVRALAALINKVKAAGAPASDAAQCDAAESVDDDQNA
jgi:hypothetical protein